MEYDEIILVDEKVVKLALEFQVTEKQTVLLEIHHLLHEVTRQEILRMLVRAGLPRNLLEDMLQDSYLKLWDVVNSFKPSRCPTFISFWRSCLRRHLISKYQRQWRHASLKCENELAEHEHHEEKDPFLEEALQAELKELDVWKNLDGKGEFLWMNKRNAGYVEAILRYRVFCHPDDTLHQKELSQRLKVTQSFLSKWEAWVLDQIRDKYLKKLETK